MYIGNNYNKPLYPVHVQMSDELFNEEEIEESEEEEDEVSVPVHSTVMRGGEVILSTGEGSTAVGDQGEEEEEEEEEEEGEETMMGMISSEEEEEEEETMMGLISEEEEEEEEEEGTVNQLQRDVLQVQSTAATASYIRVKIPGVEIFTLGLVDSGNTCQNSLISEELMQLMGGTYKNHQQHTLGTAGDRGLTVLGQAKPFSIFLEGIHAELEIQPWVVRGLAHPLNLGMTFLQQYHAVLQTNPRGNRLIIGGGSCQTVPKTSPVLPEIRTDRRFPTSVEDYEEAGTLCWKRRNGARGRSPVQQSYKGRKREHSQGNIYRKECNVVRTVQRVVVPANSLKFIPLRTKGNVQGDVMVDPEMLQGYNRHGLVIPRGVYQCTGGSILVAVVNPEDHEVTIAPFSELASVCAVQETAERLEKLETPGLEGEAVNTTEPEGPGLTDAEKEKFIRKNLRLAENSLLRDRPKLVRGIVKIFLKYWGVLSLNPDDYGKTDLGKFVIKLLPDSEPVRQPRRPMNKEVERALEKQMKTWQEQKIVEPSTSPWASPLVPVKKKDGGIRFCVDYRRLNALTVKDAYPLSNIRTNLESLQGASVYSALDASGAYHNIEVEMDSRDATSFVSPFGSFRFARLPFGLTNAGAAYSRMVAKMLASLPPGYVLAYLDDILIYSHTLEEHLEHLEKVVELHFKAGIKLQPTKTHLFCSQVNYLGHQVSAQGVTMIPEYVQRILDWPIPKTPKELATFLGFTGYYRGFIPTYAKLTCKMNSLKKGKVLEWDQEIQENFEELKQQFQEGRVQSYPRYDSEEPFILTTDWSKDAIAGILSQNQEGEEKFIGAWGRKCSVHERNYPAHKGELLAVVQACKYFQHLLKGKQFLLHTDSSPLKNLTQMKDQSPLFMRWYGQLADFNMKVIHKKGKENINADALSRSAHLPEPTAEEVAEHTDMQGEEVIITFQEPELETPAEVSQVYERISIMELQRLQEEDAVLREVRGWVLAGAVPARREILGQNTELLDYQRLVGPETFQMEEGVLWFTRRLNTPGEANKVRRMCLPPSLRPVMWAICHEHPMVGHRGQETTLRKMADKCFFPGMAGFVRRQNQNCEGCLAKIKHIKPHQKVHFPSLHSSPLEKIYVDLVEMTPTRGGMRYLLTVEDGFTRYLEGIPIPNKEARTVAQALVQQYIQRHGAPVHIHSDNGLEFVNHLWRELCSLLQIQKTCTPPYNPQSNLVERAHRTLGEILRTANIDTADDWDQHVQAAIFCYNTAIHSSTGFTPYQAFFGRAARIPVDLVFPVPEVPGTTLNQHCLEMQEKQLWLYEQVRTKQKAVVERRANLYNPSGLTRLQASDQCWYFCPRTTVRGSKKLRSSWRGPYVVERLIAPSLAVIRNLMDARNREIVVGVDLLRKYTGSRAVRVEEDPENELDDEGDEFQELLGNPEVEHQEEGGLMEQLEPAPAHLLEPLDMILGEDLEPDPMGDPGEEDRDDPDQVRDQLDRAMQDNLEEFEQQNQRGPEDGTPGLRAEAESFHPGGGERGRKSRTRFNHPQFLPYTPPILRHAEPARTSPEDEYEMEDELEPTSDLGAEEEGGVPIRGGPDEGGEVKMGPEQGSVSPGRRGRRAARQSIHQRVSPYYRPRATEGSPSPVRPGERTEELQFPIEDDGGLLPDEDEEMDEPDDPSDPDYRPLDERVPAEKRRAAGFPRHASPYKQNRREAVKRVSWAETDGSPKQSRTGVNSINREQQQEVGDEQEPWEEDEQEQRICAIENPCQVHREWPEYPGKCQPWGQGQCQQAVPCDVHLVWVDYQVCRWTDGTSTDPYLWTASGQGRTVAEALKKPEGQAEDKKMISKDL